MARKNTAAKSKPATADAPPKENSSTPKPPADGKRKIDWATIDDDGTFDGFTVKTVYLRTPNKSSKSSHKKQKTAASTSTGSESYQHAPVHAEVVQKNPYSETELSEVHCKVEPAAEWESTNRYRKFTLNGEEFEVDQTVFIKKTEEEHDTPTSIPQWFARILEVRAGDAGHVYLRVYWAYRPEDLPGGRQPHHGKHELIVSNHMDVIEATTVEARADVWRWDDDPEKSEWPGKTQLYWRQSMDINKPKGKQFSKLRTHCVDQKPCNPDEPLVHCSSCKKWLHARCLEEQAVQDAYKKHKIPGPKSKGRPSKEVKQSKNASPAAQDFTAKLTTSHNGKVRLAVTDRVKGGNVQHNVDVQCLACNHTIEKADDEEAPQQSVPQTPITPSISEEGDEATSITVAPTDNPVTPANKESSSPEQETTSSESD